jgi:hypothetical protein
VTGLRASCRSHFILAARSRVVPRAARGKLFDCTTWPIGVPKTWMAGTEAGHDDKGRAELRRGCAELSPRVTTMNNSIRRTHSVLQVPISGVGEFGGAANRLGRLAEGA